MTKSISPDKVYLSKNLQQLLEKANDNARLQYKNPDGSSKFDRTEKGKKYETENLTHAAFTIGETEYTYDNLFKPTLAVDNGNTMKDYTLVDGKFRLTKLTESSTDTTYEYTYSDDGKSVNKTTITSDGNENETGFLPIQEANLLQGILTKGGKE